MSFFWNDRWMYKTDFPSLLFFGEPKYPRLKRYTHIEK